MSTYPCQVRDPHIPHADCVGSAPEYPSETVRDLDTEAQTEAEAG